MYSKGSYISKSNVVVLDIEAAFESLAGGKQDRVDLILYNKADKTLRFIETKCFDNPEIHSKTVPPVAEQIERYKNQIAAKKAIVLSAYQEYVNILNTQIYNDIGLALPKPAEIDDRVGLLIFGFDSSQKKKLEKSIKPQLDKEQIPTYAYGDIDKISLDTLWRETA
jgi:hypothetical protein